MPAKQLSSRQICLPSQRPELAGRKRHPDAEQGKCARQKQIPGADTLTRSRYLRLTNSENVKLADPSLPRLMATVLSFSVCLMIFMRLPWSFAKRTRLYGIVGCIIVLATLGALRVVPPFGGAGNQFFVIDENDSRVA